MDGRMYMDTDITTRISPTVVHKIRLECKDPFNILENPIAIMVGLESLLELGEMQ